MGKTSTLIGSVVDGNPVENRVINNEKFYTIKVSFRGVPIRVLYSQYVYTNVLEPETKIQVTGTLISDIRHGEVPDFYFYANKIDVVDIDVESTNEVNFRCTVTKVRDFIVNAHCVEILPLVASDSTPLGTTSILYICARADIARKLKDREKGYLLTGKGYLKPFRDIYEIYVNEASIIDKSGKIIEDLNN